MNYNSTTSREKVEDLINQINPIYDKVLQSIPEHFLQEKLRYNLYERITVGADNTVLSFPEEVKAAYANGVTELDVRKVAGLDADEALRFMALHMFFRRLEHSDRVALIEEYENHFTNNPKAKEWAKELNEAGHTEMNDKLALIFNVSKDLIKHVKKQESASIKTKENNSINQADFEIKMHDGKITYKGKELDYDETKISLKTK